MAKTIIGVMGPGKTASPKDIKQATELGNLIAQEKWVLLTGGRNMGVMEAASKGAHQAGGITVGILPSENRNEMSQFIDIPISTGMGSARNNINVLSSDVVVALGAGAGTTSEIMLAMKAEKPLILINPTQKLVDLINSLPYPRPNIVPSAAKAIQIVKDIL